MVLIARLINSQSSPALADIGGRKYENPAVSASESVLGASLPTPGQLASECGQGVSLPRSIVNFLMAEHQDYSFEARSQMAKERSINNYTGSSQQNLLLIRLLIYEKYASCLALN